MCLSHISFPDQTWIHKSIRKSEFKKKKSKFLSVCEELLVCYSFKCEEKVKVWEFLLKASQTSTFSIHLFFFFILLLIFSTAIFSPSSYEMSNIAFLKVSRALPKIFTVPKYRTAVNYNSERHTIPESHG